MSKINIDAINNTLADVQELLTATADIEKLGITISQSDILFDILMAAKGKLSRQLDAAMIEERKNRNTATHATIDAQS